MFGPSYHMDNQLASALLYKHAYLHSIARDIPLDTDEPRSGPHGRTNALRDKYSDEMIFLLLIHEFN